MKDEGSLVVTRSLVRAWPLLTVVDTKGRGPMPFPRTSDFFHGPLAVAKGMPE